MSFFVFVPAAVTYYGAATVGAAVASAIGVTGLSTVAVSAIGAATISAGFTAARGGSVKDVLKSAVLSGATSYVGGSISKGISSTVRADAIMNGNLSFDAADTLGRVAGATAAGAATGATRALITGQDPIEALIKGGLTAGVGAGVTEGIRAITDNIPGYDSLSDKFGVAGSAAQRAISASLAAGILGNDVEDAVKNSVLGSITNYAGSALSKGDSGGVENDSTGISSIKDLSSSIRPTYDNAEAAAEKLQANIDKQNQLVEEYNTRVTAALAKQEELQADYDNYTRLAESGDIEGANALANKLNSEVPKFEAENANLKSLESQLNATQKQYTYLENSYAVKKSLFDESVSNYQKQEEVNAETIKKAFDDSLAAKTILEETFGSELSQEQIDALVKTGNPLAAANSLKQSVEGADAESKKLVLGKLVNGVDGAITYANENITKPSNVEDDLQSAGLEQKIDTPIGLNFDSAGEARSLFANSQGALDKAADTTADKSDDYMADFLKSVGINTTDELRDSGLSNEDILRRINYTLEAGGDLDDWYKKIEDTTGLDEGPQIPNPIDTTGLDEGPVIPTDDEDKGEVIIKGGRESCPVGTRLNLETGECDPYWDETGGNNPSWDETGSDETGPATPVRDEGEVIIKGGRETCPVGTKLNPVTGECDPYWDETGGDETDPTTPDPTKPDPTKPGSVTPKTPAPKIPTTPKTPTTPGKTPAASTPSSSLGYPVPEAPQGKMVTADLANVYYYGKDFGSQKQKINEEGKLELEPYRAVGDPLNPFARPFFAAGGGLVDTDENRENNVIDALDLILGQSGNSLSLEDLLNIVKGS